MTAYYGFLPAEPVRTEILDLLARLAQPSPTPLYPQSNRLAAMLTDDVIDHLLLNLVKAMQAAGGQGHGLVLLLGGFIKTTMHGLLKVMLGSPGNAEVDRRTDFIRAVFLNLPQLPPRIGFVMPDDLHRRFLAAFDEIDAGRGKAQAAVLVQAFAEFTDLALIHFFDGFVDRLNLGFLLKKGAAVARGQMKAQSTATFGKMIPALSDAELQALADYLRQRMLTA
ncbi:MAG TPA: hypothetical protein VFW42_07690 [Fluviicoccus sp.]|nr:hypothetical protein [Fluviicoccus sp.]